MNRSETPEVSVGLSGLGLDGSDIAGMLSLVRSLSMQDLSDKGSDGSLACVFPENKSREP